MLLERLSACLLAAAMLGPLPAPAQLAEPILVRTGAATSAVLPRAAAPDERSFPFVVALLNDKGGVVCSGTLLNPRGQILTAAHCFCDPSSRPTLARIGRSVHAAERAVADELTLQRELADADAVEFLDKEFCAKRGFDLAVIATREPLEDSAGALLGGLHVATPKSPHPDPEVSKFPLGAYLRAFMSRTPVPVFAIGFGQSEVAARGGGAKRYAELKLLPCAIGQQNCATLVEYYAPDKEPAPQTCRGDSGGPVLEREDGAGWRLFAVTSRPLADNREKYCSGGGVYVSVLSPRVQNWLGTFLDAR